MSILNKELRAKLQILSYINRTMVIDYPLMMVRNDTGSIAAFYRHPDSTEKFEKFGIYNISELLSIYKLFNAEPKIEHKGDSLYLSDGNINIRYLCTDINILKPYITNEDIFTSTFKVPTVADIILLKKDFETITKIIDIFKESSHIRFLGKEGDDFIQLSVINTGQSVSNGYEQKFSLTKGSVNKLDFDILVSVQDFKSLYRSEYSIKIKEKNGMFRLLFIPDEEAANNINYIIAALKNDQSEDKSEDDEIPF